ncbi:MAG: phosphoribosylamine--glycine ligase [Cyclobacteriaceae bacterium]
MNILVLGSGGREHTLAWKLNQSSQCNHLYVAPGNAGTSAFAINVNLSPTDFETISQFVTEKNIQLVVVGPEAPLVEGVVDFLKEKHPSLHIIGPSKEGAQLEGSKDYSKEFMQRHNIPTAGYSTFTKDQLPEGLAYLETITPPFVLKADGLAAGKGVIITSELAEAKQTLTEMLADAKFGDASSKVVIEEFLDGIELSVFVLTDGKEYYLLPEAKDYKRIGEGDTGPNTGGMGAVSPVPFANSVFMDKVKTRIIEPTIQGLAKENIDYKGFIFFGLIKVDGEPMVIEYNARMGDPETQAVIPRLDADLVEMMIATSEGTISKYPIQFKETTATTVVLVAGGYPDAYEKKLPISKLSDVSTDNTLVFHAGTTTTDNNQVVTNGGRVLAVTGFGNTIEQALEKANDGARMIEWKDKNFRKDIGLDLLKLVN